MKIKRCIYCGKYYKDDPALFDGNEFLTPMEIFEIGVKAETGQCSNPSHEDKERKYYNNLSLYW